MYTIVADPVGNNIYFVTDNDGVEVVKTDGSGRTTLTNNPGLLTVGLAVDLKKR